MRSSLSMSRVGLLKKRPSSSSSLLVTICHVMMALMVVVSMLMMNSLLGVHASHLEAGLTVAGGGGSRSWRRLVDRTISAYQIISPGITIEMQNLPSNYETTDIALGPSQLNRNLLARNEVDFSTSETGAGTADLLTTPDMISIPLAAQACVIVYNLPGVTDGSFILTTAVTARIFMGNITTWNDPAIVALNPSLVLPTSNITLVSRGDVLAMNSVFNTAMGALYPAWKTTVTQVGGVINFPVKTNLIIVKNFFSHGTALSTIPYSISYMMLDEANNLGIPYASFKNSVGALISPTADSVLFAVMEKGNTPITITSGATSTTLLDLTAPSGITAWPITTYAYLILRTTAFRQTCALKNAALKFWYWFYTSTTATQLATSLSFIIPPSQTRAAHNIEGLLNSGMFCSGSLALPAERTEISLGVGTGMASALFSLYPPVYNNLASVTGTILFTETDSDDAMERLLWGEVDFAVVAATTMIQSRLTTALASGEVIQLPLFASRFVLIYSLPGFTANEQGIVLDYPTLSDIWMGVITNWNDPRIAALNPDIAAAKRFPNLNISRIVATTGARESEKIFFTVLNRWTLGTDSEYNITKDSNGVVLPFVSNPWLDGQPGMVYVQSEPKIQAAVSNLKGSIGIIIVTNALETTTLKARLKKSDTEIVADSVTASYRCQQDTFNTSTLRFTNGASLSPGCWPFTTFVYTMVRTANVDSQCVNAPRALKFLQFLHDQTSLTAEAATFLKTFTSTGADSALSQLLSSDASESTASSSLARTSAVAEQMGALWATPGVRALVQAKLKLVTCDGETILITLPVDHKISTEIQSATLGISILGACLIGLILCFIYFFHLRSAIKASSPIFLLGTVVGLLMLFISGSLLTQTDPSNDTCGSGWWMLNLGFFMTFGPLFLKTWRIYKIFMRKEMTVVRLTDMNLISRLAVALAIELILLTSMQSSDPFIARTTIQSALPRDQTIYYCSPNQLGFAATIASLKGVVLLFGALMSFSTRSVSENFNESKPIAMTIYNLLFTCVLIIPIGLLSQSDYRTLYLLAIFAVYWITFCTLIIIFVPKVVTIYKDASGLFANRISDSKASASELASRNMQGRTIKELSQQPIRLMDRSVLRTYVSLLEKELITARAALATLDANEGVLAGHTTAASAYGPRISGGTKSGLDTSMPTNGGGGTSSGNTTTMATPSAGVRTLAGSQAGRPYATGNNNGSPRAQSVSKGQPIMVNKYVASSSSGNGNNGGGRSSASVAPTSSYLATGGFTVSVGSSRQIEGKTQAPISPSASASGYATGFSTAQESDDAVPSRGGTPGPFASPAQTTTNSNAVAAAVAAANTNGGAAAHASETRFRMPGSSAASPTGRVRTTGLTAASTASSQGAISPPQTGTLSAGATSLGGHGSNNNHVPNGLPQSILSVTTGGTPTTSMRDDTAPLSAPVTGAPPLPHAVTAFAV